LYLFTSSDVQHILCCVFVYVICICLRLVVCSTYCVVVLFCFSSSCVFYVASFSGLYILIAPSVFSNAYLGQFKAIES